MYSTSRKIKSAKKNSPGWIVTFADMMALLLTFFIMLLSFSTMDTQKYKAMVESMDEAFGPGVGVDNKGLVTKMELMTGGKKADFETPSGKPIPNKAINKASKNTQIEQVELTNNSMTEAKNKAKEILNKELQQDNVQIEVKESSIVIRFPERIAFSSGSDELTSNFDPVITKLIRILNEVPGSVSISGHTDNRPIDTFRFRSNWELSSARAVSFLHAILNNSNINPVRFTIQGHADTRPIKANNSEKNRAENRRVEISIENINASSAL